MQKHSNRRVRRLVLVAVLAATAVGVDGPDATAAGPPSPPPQPVTVTNTPLPVQGSVSVANETPLTVQETKTEVIIDEYKDIDLGYSTSWYTFGIRDLSAYKQIRIMVVGDCVFEPPYNCAHADNLSDTVDLELRTLMGHPNTKHDLDHPNWQAWRTFHWLGDIQVGQVGTELLDVPGGQVEFRVHYRRGPVHLRVLGRTN